MADEAESKPVQGVESGTHGQEQHGAHGTEAGGAAHEQAKEDPLHHIRDYPLLGLDKTTGKLVWKPVEHGHPREVAAGVLYAPQMAGPFKLEFTLHMFGYTVGALVFFTLSMLVARRVLAGIQGNHAPRGKLANAVEAMVVFVRDEMVIPAGGHHLAHYTPLFINFFMLILICNYLGMIPQFGSPTGNFAITLSLAALVYLLVWMLGLAHNGLGYLAHIVPPGTPWAIWPVLFVLELMSPVIKCAVLAVRLFANMIAGHLVIGNLLALGKIAGWLMIVGVPLALGVSILEVLVCALQAYVFALLAVIFIGSAVHPEH